jgi:alkylhydroperoxidase family enzyme
MAWIREAEGYENLGNVIRCMSILPAAMEAVSNLNRTLTFGGSRLTRVQEEIIATTVSSINRCHY